MLFFTFRNNLLARVIFLWAMIACAFPSYGHSGSQLLPFTFAPDFLIPGAFTKLPDGFALNNILETTQKEAVKQPHVNPYSFLNKINITVLALGETEFVLNISDGEWNQTSLGKLNGQCTIGTENQIHCKSGTGKSLRLDFTINLESVFTVQLSQGGGLTLLPSTIPDHGGSDETWLKTINTDRILRYLQDQRMQSIKIQENAKKWKEQVHTKKTEIQKKQEELKKELQRIKLLNGEALFIQGAKQDQDPDHHATSVKIRITKTSQETFELDLSSQYHGELPPGIQLIPLDDSRYTGGGNEPQTKQDQKAPAPPGKKGSGSTASSTTQGSSSTSTTVSATGSGNGQRYARHLGRLKAIRKAVNESLKVKDQKNNIDEFFMVLKSLYKTYPGILKERGSLIDPQTRSKGIFTLLKRHFPEAVKKGDITHVFLDYSSFEQLPEKTLRKLAKKAFPTREFPRDLPNKELVKLLIEAKNDDKKHGLIHFALGHPQCLYGLVEFFISQISLMGVEAPKLYVFQDQTGHVSVFSLRKNTAGHYRIMIADSLTVFEESDQMHNYNFSALAEFISTTLLIALKHENIKGSRFFFLPSRQVDNYTCSSFMLHDLETLMESPMLAKNGYHVTNPTTNVELIHQYFSIFAEVAEQPKPLRINGEERDINQALKGPGVNLDDLRMTFIDLVFTAGLADNLLPPELVQFYRLRRFPQRFLYLTQGRQYLNQMLKGFDCSAQQEVNTQVDSTRGRLSTSDGVYHSDANLAAALLWMKMNIELVEGADVGP